MIMMLLWSNLQTVVFREVFPVEGKKMLAMGKGKFCITEEKLAQSQMCTSSYLVLHQEFDFCWDVSLFRTERIWEKPVTGNPLTNMFLPHQHSFYNDERKTLWETLLPSIGLILKSSHREKKKKCINPAGIFSSDPGFEVLRSPSSFLYSGAVLASPSNAWVPNVDFQHETWLLRW